MSILEALLTAGLNVKLLLRFFRFCRDEMITKLLILGQIRAQRQKKYRQPQFFCLDVCVSIHLFCSCRTLCYLNKQVYRCS